MNNSVFGVGINDIPYKVKNEKSYITWKEMLRRCYCPKWRLKHPTYIGCSVCDEWLYYSNFKYWYEENYINGYALDKDILNKDNKLYSPLNCCFVPKYINNLFTKRNSKRGKYLIGVARMTKAGKYQSLISKYGKCCHIGYFNTEMEAFNAYKKAKEEYIKEVAQKSIDNNEISILIYNALIGYNVLKND